MLRKKLEPSRDFTNRTAIEIKSSKKKGSLKKAFFAKSVTIREGFCLEKATIFCTFWGAVKKS